MQALVLDAVGSISYLVNKVEGDKDIGSDNTRRVLQDPVKLLGKMSVQISKSCRKGVLNSKMQDMVDKADFFTKFARPGIRVEAKGMLGVP